jgi:dTDP-4-amino-4,6-dideoxygalactose transaminase
MSKSNLRIPFNHPYLTGQEILNISDALEKRHLSGDGIYTKKCQDWLEKLGDGTSALLTHSCTAALEMAAILIDIKPGDEVIMPSFTFVSTANAFVLRGAVPVFVDIRLDTLNINETLIEKAITSKTKAIVAVHYAGVACNMDYIMNLAQNYNLFVIEDAAQAILSSYKGRNLGTIGHLGCFSFHETKNIVSGEGGALLINSRQMIERAEVIREKGTNRRKFLRGQVDKYTWTDIGSSYLPADTVAAFLWAQLQSAQTITENRYKTWLNYLGMLEDLNEYFLLPKIPADCKVNGHIFYLIMKNNYSRDDLLSYLNQNAIGATFHYIPLHKSPFGQRYFKNELPITDFVSSRIIRLPLWVGLSNFQQKIICNEILSHMTIQKNDQTKEMVV